VALQKRGNILNRIQGMLVKLEEEGKSKLADYYR
jgi:hypothetical protein